jgi:4-hydroxy-3-polyprenylbenzoate decarboxylase
MDLREFMKKCEAEGELKRIKKEVDWNLELSHIAKLNEEKKGPALLFEKVKDYQIPLLASAFTSPRRLAIALEMPLNFSMCDMAKRWMELTTKKLIPPVEVKTGPVLENVIQGKDVNLFKFPVPKFYPLDGGRFIGTASFIITKDLDTDWINLGTYRMQILNEKTTGVQIIKGKHADFMLKKYQKVKKTMPAAAVIGCDPLLFLAGSTLVSASICEYDIVGALRGAPCEVIKSDLTGLPLPATAELILEGEIETDPSKFQDEGPFGEYTGYYSGKTGEEWPKPVFYVKRILHRKNPTFWATSVGKPVTDTHMIQSLNRTATLWTDLENMKVPGVQSVYIPPEMGGRFWGIVSVRQMYPGHSMQVGTAVISTTTGHYGMKGVIVVDDDIKADDIDRILWALAMRYDPYRSTQIIKRGRSTPLDPALPIEAREIVSRIIMDACIPYEWERKPTEIKLDEEMVKKVQSQWKEYGL